MRESTSKQQHHHYRPIFFTTPFLHFSALALQRQPFPIRNIMINITLLLYNKKRVFIYLFFKIYLLFIILLFFIFSFFGSIKGKYKKLKRKFVNFFFFFHKFFHKLVSLGHPISVFLFHKLLSLKLSLVTYLLGNKMSQIFPF